MAAWDQADIFAIPLLDGGIGIGQVVMIRDCPPASAYCALSLRRGHPGQMPAVLHLDEVVALLFIGMAPLADGTWPVLGFDTIPATETLRPFVAARQRWMLADDKETDITDPAIAEAFLNACHGLLPWDYFPDPRLFDTMLAPKRQRPRGIMFT